MARKRVRPAEDPHAVKYSLLVSHELDKTLQEIASRKPGVPLSQVVRELLEHAAPGELARLRGVPEPEAAPGAITVTFGEQVAAAIAATADARGTSRAAVVQELVATCLPDALEKAMAARRRMLDAFKSLGETPAAPGKNHRR